MANKNNMNGIASNPSGIDLSLTPDQLELLSTALASSQPSAMPKSDLPSNSLYRGPNPMKPDVVQSNSYSSQRRKSLETILNTIDLYGSPMLESPSSAMLGSEEFESPLIDYDFDDGNYDWENSAGLMIGSLPGAANEEDNDLHEKRKSIEDDENSHKRREGEDKTVKKAGRKPITGEPTTKRKAQNRAAQRAFRERKERHLKELETKVEDLEKASESTNHENGRLRAQVERLNSELKKYKKRLSLSGIGTSRPLAAPAGYQSRPLWNTNQSDFQFAFPKFGDLPGSNFMNNGSLAKVDSSPNHEDNTSTSNGMSGVIRANSSGSASLISPTKADTLSKTGLYNLDGHQPSSNKLLVNYSDFNGLFSPPILEAASYRNSSDPVNYGHGTQVPNSEKHNSLIRGSSTSDVTSPSASSASNHGLDSSCGTSPEPSAGSPDGRKASEPTLNTINEEPLGHGGFEASSSVFKSPSKDIQGIDWLAEQNGGQFDPVLFGDYREPQEKFLASYDVYFNEAFPFQDTSNPFNTDERTASPIQKRDLIKEMELLQDGAEGDGVVLTPPSAAMEKNNAKQTIIFEKLKDRAANSEKVVTGEADISDLCDQLKRKARCNGNGLEIDPQDVDQILGPERTGQKDVLNMFR